MKTIPTSAIAKMNRDAGHQWFDRDVMLFSQTQNARVAYVSADGSKAYFVSSERIRGYGVPHGPRLYSVCVASLTDGSVKTYPDNKGRMAYKSRSDADAAAQRAATGES